MPEATAARRATERERIALKRATAAERQSAARARSARATARERTKRYGDLELAEAVKVYAERFLRVPTGLRQGKPVHLLAWQTEFLAALYGADTRVSALSLGRKNGKTGLLACLILAHLDRRGPLHKPRACILAASTTEGLSGILGQAVLQTAEASGIDLRRRQLPRPTSIEGADGARLIVLPAERTSGAHGQSADLCVIDEAGLFESRLLKHREVWQSMMTSTSATGGRVACIGTQLTGDLFGALLADESGTVHVTRYAAPRDCALDDEDAWRAANPSLGELKDAKYMRIAAQQAIASSSAEPRFRAHDLNQAVSDETDCLVQLGEWQACVQDELPERRGDCYVGIDVGGARAMCAAVLYWPQSRRLDALCAFPSSPSLAERGAADAVGTMYQDMHSAGELVTLGDKLVDLPAFWRLVESRIGGSPVGAVGADRYRQADLETALAGDAALRERWTWRGTGAHSKATGSADVRAFIGAVREQRLKVLESLVWPAALAASRLRYDAGGNPALDKRASRGRIDLLQAGVLALGLATHEQRAPLKVHTLKPVRRW